VQFHSSRIHITSFVHNFNALGRLPVEFPVNNFHDVLFCGHWCLKVVWMVVARSKQEMEWLLKRSCLKQNMSILQWGTVLAMLIFVFYFIHIQLMTYTVTLILYDTVPPIHKFQVE